VRGGDGRDQYTTLQKLAQPVIEDGESAHPNREDTLSERDSRRKRAEDVLGALMDSEVIDGFDINGRHRPRCAGASHATSVDERDAVGDAMKRYRIARGNEDRTIECAQRDDEVAQTFERIITHSVERLVQHDDAAVGENRLRDAEASPRIWTQLPQSPAPRVLESEVGKDGIDARVHALRVHTRQYREPSERIGNAPSARERAWLRQISDALSLDEAPRLDTVHPDSPAGWPGMTERHGEQRALPGSGRSGDAYDLTSRDAKRDVIERTRRASKRRRVRA
jgi:hypothetical protein